MADERTDHPSTPPSRPAVTVGAHPAALTHDGWIDRVAHLLMTKGAPDLARRPGTVALNDGSRDAYAEDFLSRQGAGDAAAESAGTDGDQAPVVRRLTLVTDDNRIDPFGYGPGVRQFVASLAPAAEVSTHLGAIAAAPEGEKHLAMADVVLSKTTLAKVTDPDSLDRIRAEVGEVIVQQFDHLPEVSPDDRPDAAKTAGRNAAHGGATVIAHYVELANWQKQIHATFAPALREYAGALATAAIEMGADSSDPDPQLGIPSTPARNLGRAEQTFGRAVQQYAYDQSRWEASRLEFAMQQRYGAMKHYSEVSPNTARAMATSAGRDPESRAKHAVFAQLRSDVREQVADLQAYAAQRTEQLNSMMQQGAGKEEFGSRRVANNGPNEQVAAVVTERRETVAQLNELIHGKLELAPARTERPEYLKDLSRGETKKHAHGPVSEAMIRALAGVAHSNESTKQLPPAGEPSAAKLTVSPWTQSRTEPKVIER